MLSFTNFLQCVGHTIHMKVHNFKSFSLVSSLHSGGLLHSQKFNYINKNFTNRIGPNYKFSQKFTALTKISPIELVQIISFHAYFVPIDTW